MIKFQKSLVPFVSERIENITSTLYSKIQSKQIDWTKLSENETTDIKDSIKNEACYLRGFVDGIRLSKII